MDNHNPNTTNSPNPNSNRSSPPSSSDQSSFTSPPPLKIQLTLSFQPPNTSVRISIRRYLADLRLKLRGGEPLVVHLPFISSSRSPLWDRKWRIESMSISKEFRSTGHAPKPNSDSSQGSGLRLRARYPKPLDPNQSQFPPRSLKSDSDSDSD